MENPDIAITLNTLAGLYYDEDNYQDAERYYLRALQIGERYWGTDSLKITFILNNLGLLYDTREDYETAKSYYQRVLQIQEAHLGLDHSDIAVSFNNLAGIYAEEEDYEAAESYYQRALSLREQKLGRMHPYVAVSLNNLAWLYGRQHHYEEAESLFKRALQINQDAFGDQHPIVATTFRNLAANYEAQGALESALALHIKASEIEEINITNQIEVGSEARKQSYMATLTGTTNGTLSLHLQSAPDNHEAATLALTTVLRRKGRVLDAMTEALQRLRQNLTPADRELLDQLATQQTQLSTLYSRGLGDQTPEQYRAEVDRLTQSIEQLENTLAQRSDEFRVATQPVNIATVQSLIPSNAALVELVRYSPFNPGAASSDEEWGNARYAAYLLNAQGEIRWVDLGEAAPIDALIQQYRTTAATQNDTYRLDSNGDIPRQLDALLMQPIRPLLGNATHLLISPDSQLNLLPFAALVNEQQRYLIEDYTITYLSSGRDLLRLQTEVASQQPPFIFAHPNYGKLAQLTTPASNQPENSDRRSRDSKGLQFGELPNTAAEADAIAPLLPGVTVLEDNQATVSALKQLQSPSILHMATHGFFLPDEETEANNRPWENPLLRSGLAFAGANLPPALAGSTQANQEDGLLTALEASSLNLRGTQLVVMSACETGLGDVRNGEGVYGLRRAIVLAGAESQVMSLWGVGDASTSHLMTLYYQNLNQGMGRSEALRQAQLSLLVDQNHPYWKSPVYWAAFTFSGDWNPL